MNATGRLLLLMKLLYEKTDADHRLTTQEICSVYEANGFPGNRNTVHDDIKSLQENGIKVVSVREKEKSYYFDGHLFTMAETRMLVDAVSAAQFLTTKQTTEMIAKLQQASGQQDKAQFLCTIPVPKTDNPEMYENIKTISNAVQKGKKIRFQYYTYDTNCQKIFRHRGEPYLFSPYELIFNDSRYYVIGFHERRKTTSSFRIDLVSHASVLDEDATEAPEDFDPGAYGNSIFRMFPGEKECDVTLECSNNLMVNIIDRFGKPLSVRTLSNGCFRAVVRCSISNTFFGWVSQFVGSMRIVDPPDVREAYAAFGKQIYEEHQKQD